MIIPLSQADEAGSGAKAASLADLIRLGCRVPDGRVVTAAALAAGLPDRAAVERLLADLTRDNADATSVALLAAAAELTLSPAVTTSLAEWVEADERYAVRSSGGLEDLDAHSFAGQYVTFLDVAAAEVEARILDCYRSQYAPSVLHYLADSGLPTSADHMAVIVQRLVAAEVSGVAFTVNPATGADTEIVLEVAPGLGEELVSGRIRPERYTYDWFEAKDTTAARGELLSREAQVEISAETLRVQAGLGRPLDIEFALADGLLHLLQARPITRIGYAGIRDQWSTANFREGVSATVCTPFMWSLYEYIWEMKLAQFILESKLLRPRSLRKLGRMYYGRPYWNMTVVKDAMAAVPGFKERQFDAEFGVRITYQGDGRTTPINPRTLLRIGRVALAQRTIVAANRKDVDSQIARLVAGYAPLLERLSTPGRPPDAVKREWRSLVVEDYLESQGTYFWQIFINTIHMAMKKDSLLKHTDEAGYLDLISGLDRVSHLLPFYDMWEATRLIRQSPDDLAYWRENTAATITRDLDAGSGDHRLALVRRFITEYGYHSAKELDVTYPDFDEDSLLVVSQFRDTVALGDEFSPADDRGRQQATYSGRLRELRDKLGDGRYAKVERLVDQTRTMLRWLEELRDVSTRYLHLIRLATLQLAEVLVDEGVLSDPSDVWNLPMFSLVGFLDGDVPATELGALLARNRTYYDSFRSFLSEDEIGATFGITAASRPAAAAAAAAGTVTGLGASNGSVTGTARVVADIADMGRLEPGDILVTRFTDTGWTSSFARLSGIVTEYGGVLCHAAIVAREYGIPAVVAAPGATSLIPDGARIHVDGATGVVSVVDAEGGA